MLDPNELVEEVEPGFPTYFHYMSAKRYTLIPPIVILVK
jgi:hypothetical protein